MSRPSRFDPADRVLIDRLYGHAAAAGSDAALALNKSNEALELLARAIGQGGVPAAASAGTTLALREAYEALGDLHGLLVATCDQLARAEMAAQALQDG